MLNVKDTAAVMVKANTQAIKLSAGLTAGNIINRQIVKVVRPKLPAMIRGYADSEFGEAVIANAVAAAIITMLPENKRATTAAKCMIEAASVKFVGSFNLEQMLEDALAGVALPVEDSEKGE